MSDEMSFPGRARLAVELGEGWRMYQPLPPPGWSMLGVVSRDGSFGARAALARNEHTDIYVAMIATVVSSLDQRKVKAAIAAAGVEAG